MRIRSPLASRRNSLGCCRSHNALHYPATLPSASNHVLSRVARWNVARLAAEFARVRTPGDSSFGVTSLSSSRVDVPLHRCDRDGRDPTSWCTTVRWSSRRHAFYDRMIVAGAYGSTYAYPGTHGHRVLSSDPKSVACHPYSQPVGFVVSSECRSVVSRYRLMRLMSRSMSFRRIVPNHLLCWHSSRPRVLLNAYSWPAGVARRLPARQLAARRRRRRRYQAVPYDVCAVYVLSARRLRGARDLVSSPCATLRAPRTCALPAPIVRLCASRRPAALALRRTPAANSRWSCESSG